MSSPAAVLVASASLVVIVLSLRRRTPSSAKHRRRSTAAAPPKVSHGPNGLERMAGGNPAGEPCPSIARFGKCNKRACSYSHQLAHALSARGGGGGDATGSGGGGGGGGGSGKPRRGGQSALRSRFYAKSADGLLPCSLRFVDRFLRWECGRHLLGIGLFPDDLLRHTPGQFSALGMAVEIMVITVKKHYPITL